MISATLWCLFCFAIIYMTGLLIQPSNLHKPSRNHSETYLLGFIFLTVLCSYIAIFIPLNETSLVFLAFLSFVGCWFRRKTILPLIQFPVIGVSAIILALLFAVVMKCGTFVYDTGLYHSQNIQWIRNFETIIGLGNLHGRLAFNTQFFPISALFTFETNSYIIYSLNAISVTVLCINLMRSLTRDSIPINEKAIYLCLLFFILIFFTKRINSPQPDLVCATLMMFAFLLYLRRSASTGNRTEFIIALLLLLCPLMKLSTLLILIFVIPIFLKFNKKNKFLLFAFGALLYAPYFLKNYMLSGYLIYPFPMIDLFNPDWKIPFEKAYLEKVWIESWAKIPFLNYKKVVLMNPSEWIPIWFASKALIWKIIFSFNLLFTIPTFTILYKLRKDLLVLFLMLILNVIFWLFTAPDPRFAYGIIFIFTTLNVYALASFIPANFSKFSFRPFIFVILIATVISNFSLLKTFPRSIAAIVFPTEKTQPSLKTLTTNFTYSYPSSGDQCAFAPIPCAAYPRENLVLRKNSIEGGFKIGSY